MKPKLFSSLVCLLACLVLAVGGTASAQDDRDGDDWRVGLALYGWYADISGDAATGGETDVGADDLLNTLKMGAMGLIEVHKGNFSFLTDVIYIDVADDTNITSGLKAEIELTNWIVTPMIAYRLVANDAFEFSFLAGARYLYLGADLTLSSHAPLPPGQRSVSDSGDIWDGIIGVRGKVKLSESWYLPYHLDVGTGESDLTWQAMAGIGVRLGIVDIIAGYRYLDWEFDNRPVIDNLAIHGPFAGIKLWF